MQEESLPLIPKPVDAVNHDVGHVLREAFQDVLEMPKYPENVARNLLKNNIENNRIKEGARRVENIVNCSLLSMEDIGIVEEKIMYRQGEYLMRQSKESGNKCDRVSKLLKREIVMKTIDRSDVHRYGLIESGDLLPDNFHKTMDFTLNKNQHECKPCFSEIQLVDFPTNEITKMKPVAKEEAEKTKERTAKTPVEGGVKIQQNPFQLSTDKIIFSNYVLNKTYKRLIRMTNVSKKAQSFSVASFPKSKCFTVLFEETGNNKIFPGLSVNFLVTFKTDNYLDIQDQLVIDSRLEQGDAHLTVLLMSRRDAPNLFMYVCRNVFPVKCSLNQFDIGRSIVLNNSIDCGACFLTNNIQVFLIIKNSGGEGQFFFMSEENWFDSDIKTLYNTLELEVGSFIISPAYFEISNNEYIQISIEFRTKLKGMNLENVVLLCNNTSHQKLDLIADGVVFDRYCIIIDEENLLRMNQLRYILYVPKSEAITYPDIGEAVDAYDSEIRELKNELENNFGTYNISSSTNDTTFENQCDVKSTSEAVLNYLNYPNQEAACEGFAKPKKYYYKYLLFFESAIPFKRNSKVITISNNCLVDLQYYWTVEDTGSESLGYENLKDLNGKCLELNLNQESSLPSNRKTNVDIVLKPDCFTEGFYRLALNMFVKSVPKCAIEHSENFFILEYPESNLVDIHFATFEIVCRIAPFTIEFTPADITPSKPLKYGEVRDFTVFVNVFTEDRQCLEGRWIIENENVKIRPSEVVLKDSDNIEFTLTVESKTYDCIDESLVFSVNNFYKKTLPLLVNIQKPTLRFPYEVFDLGCLQLGNKYGFKFIILNENYVSVDFEIWEKYKEDLTSNDVEISIKNLEDNNIQVQYIVDAKKEVSWESQLHLYTTFNKETTLDSTCLLKYCISKLEVFLHTQMSPCPILSPKEILYINTKHTYTLCLHNTGSISTNFFFGAPQGEKSDFFHVNVIRSVGYLEAGTTVKVNIEITPKCVGVVDEVFIPCYFKQCSCFGKGLEREVECVKLALLFVVEDIFVNVSLPENRKGVKEVITWPPQVIYDFDYDDKEPYEDLTMGEEEEESYKSPVENISFDLNEDISKYLNTFVYPHPESDDEGKLDLLVPNNSKQTTILSSDSGLTEFSRDSLKQRLSGKEFMIQEHVLEVFDVPLRKLIRRNVVIENRTPVEGAVNMETVNFNPVSFDKKRIDGLLEKMNIKEFDDFDKMLPDEGIWIKAEADSKKLEPFGKINIELSIYANTWGTYADELLIEINETLPLCISVLVDVTGSPLEFINFKNSLLEYPILRFGSVPYKSDPLKRKIYFKNVSYVPINITWHAFLKTKDRNNKPLTLMFDIFHPNLEVTLSEHDSMGNLMMLFGKYFGNKEQFIFNIEPKESFVNTGETKFLEVTFDPRAFAASFKQKIVEAYLIGYVQISKQFQYVPNEIVRKFGSRMDCLKVKLTATLELPILQLELVRGDLKFVFYATHVVEGNGRQSKQLCFKNSQKCSAAVHFQCDEPLTIERIETVHDFSRDGTIVVSPNESVDVKISYTLETKFIKTVATTLCNANYDPDVFNYLDYDASSHKIVKYINIKQKGTIKQIIPIDIITYFPNLEMTSNLEFGFVFIGNNKKRILTIWNYTTCPVPFKLESTGDLILNPTSGVLDSMRQTGPSHVDISVIFIPRIYKAYLETILLTTNIPGFLKKASVRGIGTHDEKHFSHDLC